MTLKVLLLNGPFVTPPRLALMTYIKDNYTITAPAKADVRFDLRFVSNGRNFIVVENVLRKAKSANLGNGRIRYTDTKRIQVLCRGINNADTNLFNIEEHLDDIINSNKLGMTSYGIEQISLDEFVPLTTVPDSSKSLSKEFVYRSRALCTLIYDKIQ